MSAGGHGVSRRQLLVSGVCAAPGISLAGSRPRVTHGVQTGDVALGRAVVWARSDRPAQLVVEYATTPSFGGRRRVRGTVASAQSGWTARALIHPPPGQTIFVRAWFEDGRTRGEPAMARFCTPADGVRILWSGDTAGQGYGINPEWGGMRIYETMRRREPHVFIHCGDTIYADGPIPAEVRTPLGVWRNWTMPEKLKVAETLDEFRASYLYNLHDDNVRRFNAEVAQIWLWDDHEVRNNWSPGADLAGDGRYREKDISVLARRARQAFLEFAPIGYASRAEALIFRHLPLGPLVDLFALDMRSYRGPNNWNRQIMESGETAYLGERQLSWLADGLERSRGLWKIIAADMPLGVVVSDGRDAQGRPRFENCANGDGPPLGRELEIARLLQAIKRLNLRNVIWVTADVHYTAAHHFHPDRAQFKDFLPFWEFVSGPLNAGTFGPSPLDNTFGPQVIYCKAPPPGQSNLPPSAGLQFFGEIEIDRSSRCATVTLRDVGGGVLFSQRLEPA